MPTTRKNLRHCLAPECSKPLFLGGLCEEHHAEKTAADRRKNDAHVALHNFVVDGKPFQEASVREEMLRLGKWWHDACDVINCRIERRVPKDEAEYVLCWCTSLAEELVDAERRSRTGGHIASPSLEATRGWVWERLMFLEAGLQSNGVARAS